MAPRYPNELKWGLLPAAVAGDSMLPGLRPGDLVLVLRGARCARGDVVAVRDPRRPERVVVKRAAERTPAGGWWVLGDNPRASTDSRVFGPVPDELLVGWVVLRYWPRPRILARWRSLRVVLSDHLTAARRTAPRRTPHRSSTWP